MPLTNNNNKTKTMAESSSDQATSAFDKFSFVCLKGLQSAAGQKLNGSHALLITGEGIKGDNDGMERFAIRIYAQKKAKKSLEASNQDANEEPAAEEVEYEAVQPPKDKKIKAINLALTPQLAQTELFKATALTTIQELQMKEDNKKLLWWLECYHKARPEELNMAVSYASALRMISQDYKRASDLMWDFYDAMQEEIKGDVMAPYKARFLYDQAMCFAGAREHLEEALQSIQRILNDESIDSKDPENQSLATEALYSIMQACDHSMSFDNGLGNTNQMANIKLNCAKVLLELDPTSPDAIANLGASYCQIGNNMEGARYYRAALACERELNNPTNIRHNLVLAQMQCPGLPLENLHILGVADVPGSGERIVSAIPKDQREGCKILHRDAATNMGYLENTGPGTMDIVQVTLPSDPDDDTQFPASLLEQVQVVPDLLLVAAAAGK
jgi:hypothetical protein